MYRQGDVLLIPVSASCCLPVRGQFRGTHGTGWCWPWAR
jgi:hypothetical protein